MDTKTIKIKTSVPQEIVKKVNLLLSNFLPEIYRYNNLVRNKNYYLKPVHIVIKKKSNGSIVKYQYYGRYWYRLERKPGRPSRIKWVYMGKEKPEKELPDPPRNPLDGLVIKISDNEVEIIASKKKTYQLIYEVLASLQYPLIGSQAQ